MKKWLKKTLAIMLIAVLMPVTYSFAVEENTADFNEANTMASEEEIVQITKDNGLSVIGCSSYSKEKNDTQPPENAIDGNFNTIWHSDYVKGTDGSGYDRERYLLFDLGKEYYLSKVIYYPRQDINTQTNTGYNGIFKDCNIYAGTNKDDLKLLKSETGWAKDSNKKEVVVDTTEPVRYVKVEGKSTYVNKHEEQWYTDKFASAAEIEFYVKSTPAYDCMIERANGNYYGSFVNAVNNAQNGETVKLLRDIELSQAITIRGKNITIDGHNGDSNFTINLINPNTPYFYYFFTINGQNSNVTFDGVTVDGGAVWSGNFDSTLQRGTENTGKAVNAGCIGIMNSADLNINDCVFQNFDSNQYYALIYATSPANRVNSDISINNSVLKDNAFANNGTVIYAEGNSYGNVNISIKDSDIYGNQNISDLNPSSNTFGSTICMFNGSSLDISGGSVYNNDGGPCGGAVFLLGGNYDTSVTVGDSAQIKNNNAQYGGAFYTYASKASLNLNDCTISQNNAEEGGAVYVNDGTVNIGNGAKLENNNAINSGGAISVANGVLNLEECQFNNNTSQKTGGAISLDQQSNGTVNLGNAVFSGNRSNDFEAYEGGERSKGNAIFYFGGTLNITGQPILSDDEDIYVEYTTDTYSNFEKINIVTDNLEEKSILVTPQYCNTYHSIADIDPSIQDTADRQAILKAFYFPEELKLNEKAVYLKENEIFYGDPASYTVDLPEFVIKFADEEVTAYDFNLAVNASGTDVSYKWYESDTKNGTYTLIEDVTGNDFDIIGMGEGQKYYYCVIDNGEISSNGPIKSNVCKVKVIDSEFYPCSYAIEKFRDI